MVLFAFVFDQQPDQVKFHCHFISNATMSSGSLHWLSCLPVNIHVLHCVAPSIFQFEDSDRLHSIMGFVVPMLLSMCVALSTASALESGPAFPDGVAALIADMRDRMSSSSAEHGDDSEAVANLKKQALVEISKDLADDEQATLLETTAFAMVQARVLKLAYVGGCPRDMSGCPTSWADQGSGVCDPPPKIMMACVQRLMSKGSARNREKISHGNARRPGHVRCHASLISGLAQTNGTM